MSRFSDELLGQVASLEARAESVTRRKRSFLRISLVPLVLGGGLCGLAASLGPDAQPSSIDLPAEIMALFGATAWDGRLSMIDQISVIAGMTIALGLTVLPIAIVYLSVTTSNGGTFLAGLFLCLFLSGAYSRYGPWNEPERKLRIEFVRAAEKHRFEEVAGYLEKMNQGTTPAGLYVLAQISIAEGKNELPVSEDLVREILSPSTGFMPKGEALYAIEHAVYGRPRSAAALAYRDAREAQQRWAENATVVLIVLSAVLVSVGLGLGFLRYAISRRVRRIRSLLTLDTRHGARKRGRRAVRLQAASSGRAAPGQMPAVPPHRERPCR